MLHDFVGRLIQQLDQFVGPLWRDRKNVDQGNGAGAFDDRVMLPLLLERTRAGNVRSGQPY